MALSMYQASIPVFQHTLTALAAILDKVQAHAAAKKIDPSVLLGTRLAPDMFPLSRQVQIACDFAKGAGARLAGIAVPSYEDSEKSIPELKARIAKTQAFLATLTPAQIDGSETRGFKMKVGPQEMDFVGQPYLLSFALPNFYFHATIVYAILRANGVDVGKFDFLGMARPAWA